MYGSDSSRYSSLLWMLKETFEALSVEFEDDEVLIEWDDDPVSKWKSKDGTRYHDIYAVLQPDLEGRKVIAYVVEDEWQGQPRSKVRHLRALGQHATGPQ